MRKAAIMLCALLLVAATAAPSRAYGHGGFHGGFHGSFQGGVHPRGFHPGFHHRFRSHVFIGGGPWWGRGLGWDGPWYAPYPYWYYPYPSVVIEQPRVYIQQRPASLTPANAGFWYYCASAKEYYPKVGTCPEAWIRVAPALG